MYIYQFTIWNSDYQHNENIILRHKDRFSDGQLTIMKEVCMKEWDGRYLGTLKELLINKFEFVEPEVINFDLGCYR